jgi:hypothetical protein
MFACLTNAITGRMKGLVFSANSTVNHLAEMTIYDDPPPFAYHPLFHSLLQHNLFLGGLSFNPSFSLPFEQRGQSFLSKLIIMASGAPIPVPVTAPEEKILCIADLEKAGSRKMEKGVRGELNGGTFRLISLFYTPVMPFDILFRYAPLNLNYRLRSSQSYLSLHYKR